MYHWVRTYSAKIGRMEELLQLTREAIAHLEKAHQLKCVGYTKVGGNPMGIGLHGAYESLGALGELESALANDAAWAAILKKAEPLVAEGSLEDQFWNEI